MNKAAKELVSKLYNPLMEKLCNATQHVGPFLNCGDKETNEAINDLYPRLRILGLSEQEVSEFLLENPEKCVLIYKKGKEG